MKVLVADDDHVSRRMLQSSLQRQGYDVVAAANGIDATAILLGPDAPRLAILDWVMPGADGLAVCHTIREQASAYVYVIILTSKDRKEDLAAAFDAGVDDFLTKPFEPVELRGRLRSGERVIQLQNSLMELTVELQRQATHDSLTGLWNRPMVLKELEGELKRSLREGRPVSVVMADVDHFKNVNDQHGHAAGDHVLRGTAERIVSGLRAHDRVSRYGGEEFLFFLPGADVAAAAIVAERVRAAVCESPIATGERTVPVTLSLGLATTNESTDVEGLIATADAAMYRAKARGRNRVEL